MAKLEKVCEEFTTFVLLIISEFCMFVRYFIPEWLMMAMLAISFALSFHIIKFLWIAEKCFFSKVLS